MGGSKACKFQCHRSVLYHLSLGASFRSSAQKKLFLVATARKSKSPSVRPLADLNANDQATLATTQQRL
jgi:hypothetical protein